MPSQKHHPQTNHSSDGRIMRFANGDVMTALTRACMLLCTGMVGLLIWQAEAIIAHMKEQDVKIEQAIIHQATLDGSLLMLQNIESENARRIGKLEDIAIDGRLHR